jgi:hypothetical protein
MVRMVYLLLPVLVRQLFLLVLGAFAAAYGILNGLMTNAGSCERAEGF